MFVVGTVAAIASYLIGWGIGGLVGTNTPPPICNCSTGKH